MKTFIRFFSINTNRREKKADKLRFNAILIGVNSPFACYLSFIERFLKQSCMEFRGVVKCNCWNI